MTRYADPERCPDCLSRMPYGSSRCPACGLSLEGPLAARLFATLSTADRLLDAMRAPAPVPVAASAATTPPGAGPPRAAVPPGAPSGEPRLAGEGVAGAARQETVPPAEGRGGLRGTSVPKILLGLGALCLLVAAMVFLAVAWSAMGVAGRTATLVGITLLAAGLSAWAARRDLRAAAEALSVVALGLVVFDMIGARTAGWLGDVTLPVFFVELGAALCAVGTAAAVWARWTPVRVLRGAEVLAAIGVGCVAGGMVAADWLGLSGAFTLAVVLTGAAALGARLVRLPVLSVGTAALCLMAWLTLASSSWERATVSPTMGELWGGLEIWPLLAAAAFVGVLALVPSLPLGIRVAALSVALVVLSGAVLAPVTDETATDLTAVGALVVLVLSVGGWLLPQPWRRSFGAAAGLGLVWMSVAAVLLALEGVERIVQAGTPPWAGVAGESLPARVPDASSPAAWLLPLLVAVAAAALVALARSFAWADRLVAPLMDVYLIAGGAAATAVLTVALYPVPMWVVALLLLAAGGGLVAASLLRGHALPLSLAAVFFAVALVLGLHDAWLTLLTVVVVLVAAGLVHLRWPGLEVSVGAGALVSGSAAGVVWTIGKLADLSDEATAVAVVLVLAALVLGGPYVDERIRLSGPATYARLGTEAGALVAAGTASLTGVESAPLSTQATWAAVYLTLTGATASAMALLRPDRRLVGWLGGFLLAAASWVRLADLGVDAPEAYTLPAAVALLVVGLVHLRRHPRAGTMAALTPGLLLALVPSLLWVLADPVALRAVLLGLACLAMILGGARLRWSAPVVYGALVGAALVGRYAVPVAQGIPQWVLIGAAGVLLVVAGITWEQRVRDARRVAGYVRGLR